MLMEWGRKLIAKGYTWVFPPKLWVAFRGFDLSRFTLKTVFNFPGMIKCMPGNSTDIVARSPADATARSASRDLVIGCCYQRFQDDLLGMFQSLPRVLCCWHIQFPTQT